MKKMIIIILLFIVISTLSADTTDVLSAELDSSTVILNTVEKIKLELSYKSEKEKKWKLDALDLELHKKRKVASIGTAVLSTALLFDYAVIKPAQRNLDPNDPASGGDQLALMSPGILTFMMKLAGSTMSSMRTSETVDAYVDITGAAKPTNNSWKLYWAGWGSTLIAGMVASASSFPGLEEYENGLTGTAMGLQIGADILLLANGIYSILYTGKIRKQASDIPVKVVPTVNATGAGLSLNVSF